jgi:acyl carrier protein
MSIEEFIVQFETVVEGIDPGELKPETPFRDLPQWNSLAALTLLVMVNSEYDVTLSGNEIKSSATIQDLYNLVAAKKA